MAPTFSRIRVRYNAFDLHEESKEAVQRILINADIMIEANDKLLCTVGGLLVFGKNPEKRLPQNGVSFAHFKGVEITDELIDKKVITGRIQDIAEQLMVVLKNNMKAPSVLICFYGSVFNICTWYLCTCINILQKYVYDNEIIWYIVTCK